MRYSLVIPFHNEAGNIEPLLARTFPVLEGLPGDFETILVNDGSTDTTAGELAAATAGRDNCVIVNLPANRGQAEALRIGLERARGGIILTMDGDGQNDARDFPALLEPLERGTHDLVCGLRTPRNDSLVRRFMSGIANTVRARLLCDGVDDAGCQLRAFRREILSALVPSPLLQAFIPAMAVAAGFRVTQLPVRHHPRRVGQSKYSFAKLAWRPCVEMLRLRKLLRQRSQRTDR